MNESWVTKVVLSIVVLLIVVLIFSENQRKTKEVGLLTVQGLCSGSTLCLSQSSSVSLSSLNIQSDVGPASQAPWYGNVQSGHEVHISTEGQSCALSALSVTNLNLDDEEVRPHFLLHFGRCNGSQAAPATEMAMIAEITAGGPCGLRQWLCDIDPPFGCHTTMTTTSFTQTSTLHLEKESLKASFQNPSLKCLGDREYINWASSNQECAEATLLRHAANSQVCAYHFADSGCYVFNCREEYGQNFGDVNFCYELLTYQWKRRLREVAKETEEESDHQVPLDALRIEPGVHVSVFKVPENSEWVTDAQPIVYRIGDDEAPAVLQTCQLDLDVIKRDTDAGFFYPYALKKVEPAHSFQSDIDPSCSPGYCGFNFQHADDLADPLCWLKLVVLSLLAGYLTNYLLESLQLRQAWNWLILSAESFISCCLCYAPGYDDLARVEQWGGAYAYTPLCASCSTRSATRAVSRPPPEDHYKVEVSACKNYSPAILNILDTILNGKPAGKDLDRFVKKLMSKRVFEEPGLVDCILMAETLQNRSCSSVADASWNLAGKLWLPNLIFVLLLLLLTEVLNFEGLYLAEVFPAMMLAIVLIGLMFLLRSLSPSFLWHVAADSTSARRGILLRLVMHDGERVRQKVGGPLCRHVNWTREKLETLAQVALEDLTTDAEVKKLGISKIALTALSQNGSLLDGLLHSHKLAELSQVVVESLGQNEFLLNGLPHSRKFVELKGIRNSSADAEKSLLVRMAVQQDGLALEHALKDAQYFRMLRDVNAVDALKGTDAQILEALKKKSAELEVLQLAVEQTGLALCAALDVVLPQDGVVGDVPFSFFTESELVKAVKSWRGKGLDETMARVEAQRAGLPKLKKTDGISSQQKQIDIQLMLILEEAIENHPDVLVKLQSMSKEVEINLAQDGDEHNHLVELAKAHSFASWVKYRSRSECCRNSWKVSRLLLSCSIGSLVAYTTLKGLGVLTSGVLKSWPKLGELSALIPSSGCLLSAIQQPTSLLWAIFLGLAVAVVVFVVLPQDLWLPLRKPGPGGVLKELRELLEDLEPDVNPHILHAFVCTSLLNLCIAWLLCCCCRWLHWCFAARACNHFVASGMAPAPFVWTDFLAQAFVATAGKAAAAAGAPALFQLMTPPMRSVKVALEEEEEEEKKEEKKEDVPPPPREDCYLQVVKLKIVKHRAGLMYHLFKAKRAFHLKITQKLSDSENRRILIRKTLVMHPSSVWTGGFHFNGAFWGNEKVFLQHDLHFQLEEPGTGKRWEKTISIRPPIQQGMKVELMDQSRTGHKAILDLKLHSSLPDHDPMPHWSHDPSCTCCSNP